MGEIACIAAVLIGVGVLFDFKPAGGSSGRLLSWPERHLPG